MLIMVILAESVMEPYLRFLHTYVSVSGPHLGYMYSSNSLFNSGLWLLKKFKNTQCIHQLTFSDDPDLRNTFLYKLCKVSAPTHLRSQAKRNYHACISKGNRTTVMSLDIGPQNSSCGFAMHLSTVYTMHTH